VTVVAVVGPGDSATGADEDAARAVGRLLGERGVTVVTGGLGGVMAAASEGAASAGAVVVGILPAFARADANPWVTVALPTGLGELRNGLIVRAADALVAVGRSLGTLSEVALARRVGKRVVGVGFSYDVEGVEVAGDAASAVALVTRRLSRARALGAASLGAGSRSAGARGAGHATARLSSHRARLPARDRA
jgi:uncharacterized protein (TIGR00725 family)